MFLQQCIKYLVFHLKNAIIVCDMHVSSLLIFHRLSESIERFWSESENSTDRNGTDDDSVGRRRQLLPAEANPNILDRVYRGMESRCSEQRRSAREGRQGARRGRKVTGHKPSSQSLKSFYMRACRCIRVCTCTQVHLLPDLPRGNTRDSRPV